MAKTVHCHDHGECEEAFVCSHLTEGTAGLGFNSDEPSSDKPFPDAWCDDCNLIFQTHGGWNEESEKLVSIRLLCSDCYELARIRNTITDVTFDDLASLRWKCYSCEQWHTGPCLDFGFNAPIYWDRNREPADQYLDVERLPHNFLSEDLCIYEGQDYFVRGTIPLPIIGTSETFRWGVWGSLSEENFKQLVSMFDDPKRVELPPMFSWLSNQIEEYDDTLNLKMYAHLNEPDKRPTFELEPKEHQLSQEYYHGITAERVKEIMSRRLKETA